MFFLIILIKYQHIHQIGLPFSGNGNCGVDKSDFVVKSLRVIGNVGKSVEAPLTTVGQYSTKAHWQSRCSLPSFEGQSNDS